MMLADALVLELFETRQASPVPDVTFRGFQGAEDYAAMVVVLRGSKDVDGLAQVNTVEEVADAYQHLVNCEPSRDVHLVEVAGHVVGYGRVWWQVDPRGGRLYQHFAHLLPAWRGRGIRREMLHRNERRLREIAASHSANGLEVFEAWAADAELDWQALLVREGYKAVRYYCHLVRPDLEDTPHLPLPAGLEVRPVEPEHLWSVWEAAREAFQDQWGAGGARDAWFEEWQQSPTFDPSLWQVAWDGDEVAGLVLSSVDREENRQRDRKRGYTEGICVRQPWRRRGLARALMARSFAALSGRGMTEAALAVDTPNSNGALRLYKSMGYRLVRQHTIYQKPLGVG